MPRIELHARIFFRHVVCPNKREDFVAETLALAWKWFLRLEEKGKDASTFAATFASLAAKAAGSGRRICGQESAKDVFCTASQNKRGFRVTRLPQYSSVLGSVWQEALEDNTISPVPEQVAFRCDFPRWRSTHRERDRRIMDKLMQGQSTAITSRRHGLSPSRISQLRREFKTDWERFCADSAADRSTEVA
jgi:hypothetical protein